MAQYLTEEFYPAPFPTGLKTIELPEISLAKLLDDDEVEQKKVFDICCNEGFFHLNMMDHPKGVKFLDDAHNLHRMGKEFLTENSVEVKKEFKTRENVTHLDSGYKCTGFDKEGDPERVEIVNIPQSGFFGAESSTYTLPRTLQKYESLFRSTLRDGNVLHNVVLSVLEKGLRLPTGSFTSMHRLNDASGDFCRVLRLPAPKSGLPLAAPPNPAHRDAVTIAMLFTWLGGLQITDSKAEVTDTTEEPEESWYWVPPKHGYALVNLGDTMTTFTNGVLKSGKHRSVNPPGEQIRFDRYSVLCSGRPANETEMRPLVSPLIPVVGEEEVGKSVPTALQWSQAKVNNVLRIMQRV